MAVGRGVARSVEREGYWRGHMRGQGLSGESIRGYCRSRGISEPGFYYWKRELARRDSQRDSQRDSRRDSQRDSRRDSRRGADRASHGGTNGGDCVAFAEVRVAPLALPVAAIEIVLAGSRRISVHPGFDEATLSRVLAVLEQSSC